MELRTRVPADTLEKINELLRPFSREVHDSNGKLSITHKVSTVILPNSDFPPAVRILESADPRVKIPPLPDGIKWCKPFNPDQLRNQDVWKLVNIETVGIVRNATFLQYLCTEVELITVVSTVPTSKTIDLRATEHAHPALRGSCLIHNCVFLPDSRRDGYYSTPRHDLGIITSPRHPIVATLYATELGYDITLESHMGE